MGVWQQHLTALVIKGAAGPQELTKGKQSRAAPKGFSIMQWHKLRHSLQAEAWVLFPALQAAFCVGSGKSLLHSKVGSVCENKIYLLHRGALRVGGDWQREKVGFVPGFSILVYIKQAFSTDEALDPASHYSTGSALQYARDKRFLEAVFQSPSHHCHQDLP